MMRKFIGFVATSTIAGTSLFAGNTQQDNTQQNSTSLGQIQEMCRDLMGNKQIKMPRAELTCTASKTFYVPTGSEQVEVGRHQWVSVQASIKDGRMKSDVLQFPSPMSSKTISCSTFAKHKATASRTVYADCAEILKVTDIQAYCNEKLADKWASCESDKQESMQQGGAFQVGQESACEWEATGEVVSCGGQPSTEQQSPEQQGGKVVDHTSTSSSSSEGTSSLNEHGDSGTTLTSEEEPAIEKPSNTVPQVNRYGYLGAKITTVKYKYKKKILGFSAKVRMAVVQSVPADKTVLSQMKMQQGEAIYTVNGRRVFNQKNLQARLQQAQQKKQAFTVEYRQQNGQFATKRVLLR